MAINKKKYLLKFYVFMAMYIIAALFILYLTFRVAAHAQEARAAHLIRVSAETETRVVPVIIIDAGHGAYG